MPKKIILQLVVPHLLAKDATTSNQTHQLRFTCTQPRHILSISPTHFPFLGHPLDLALWIWHSDVCSQFSRTIICFTASVRLSNVPNAMNTINEEINHKKISTHWKHV